MTDPFVTAVFTVGAVGARQRPASAAAAEVSLPRRLLGGSMAGLVGGLGMYVVLATVAVGQGRGMAYPIQAVHALLSGKRVLPDHPHPALAGGQLQDLVTGPIYFFLPAIAIGVLTAYRLRERDAETGWAGWTLAGVVPAALAAGLMLIVFVVGIAGHEVDQVAQRFSSGYGIRQLGSVGWLAGHLVYVVLVASTLRPLTLGIARVTGGRPNERTSRTKSARRV